MVWGLSEETNVWSLNDYLLSKGKGWKVIKTNFAFASSFTQKFSEFVFKVGKLGGKICRKMLKNLREIFSGALFDEIYAHCG